MTMAELLKNIYNERFFEGFLTNLKRVIPELDDLSLVNDIYCDDWEILELKQRMRQISTSLSKYLNSEFKLASGQIVELVNLLIAQKQNQALEYMFLPDFIEIYGIDDYKTSIVAFETITKYTSCEFAIRPFIVRYQDPLMDQMLAWSKNENHHVRRLSSEGCRPRLPWAMALPKFKKDPKLIIPILKNLKDDKSEYIRKSVANNLNDLTKDNPEIVIQLTKKWIGKSEKTDWILKHGCRTLLKQGNQVVMQLFGFGSTNNIEVLSFKVENTTIEVGDYLNFSFELQNNNKSTTKIRLEYVVYYQKANGTLTKKVYQISEKEHSPNSLIRIERSRSFKPITTRKFHSGLHQIAVIVNGIEQKRYDFLLK